GKRLFDEHVLAGVHRGAREPVMRGERRRNYDCVHVAAVDQAAVVGTGLHARMTPFGRLPALRARVGDGGELNPVGFRQIAAEVRSPVAVADETNLQHRERNSAAAAATYCTSACSRNGCIGSDTISLVRRSVTGKSPTL